MNLLYVFPSTGGFGKYRANIARILASEGHLVQFAIPVDSDASQIEAAGFDVFRFRLIRSSINPWYELKTRNDLRALYAAVQPDLVHHYYLKPVIHGGLAARAAKVQAVMNSVAGLGWAFSERTVKSVVIQRIVLRSLGLVARHPNARFIVQNAEDGAVLLRIKGIHADRVHKVAGSGVDLEHFRRIPEAEGKPVIVLPARLLWSKGIAEFVEASRILKGEGYSVRFAIVGAIDEGNPGAVPAKALRDWHDKGTVEYWGWMDDMRQVYGRAAAICLPSYYREGVPRVLLEAAAAGRAVITTDMPGCRDACVHQETGILVPPKNPRALADAVRQLLEDPQRCSAMGRAGRSFVELHFSQETVTASLIGLYRQSVERTTSS